MIASHYVIEELIHVIEEGDKKHLNNAFAKFAGRYYKDKELAKVYKAFKSNGRDLDKIRNKLVELHTARKIESGGAFGLPFSSLRRARKKEIKVPKKI